MPNSSPPMALNDWLVYRGRFVNVTFLLKVDEAQYLVKICEGRVTGINPGPHVMPRWTFALTASADTWKRFWSGTPEPGFHDLMAMLKFKTLRIEGDQTIFMQNLLYFKELVRQLGGHIHAS